MTVVTTAYQPPTPDLLLLALQHYDGVQDRVDELLGLSDQSLAELTRSLLKKPPEIMIPWPLTSV